MKKLFHCLAFCALCFVFTAGCSKEDKSATATSSSEPETVAAVETDAQKTSYVLGVDNGRNLKQQFKDLNVDMKAMAQGFSDQLNKRPIKYSAAEIEQTIDKMRKKVFEKVDVQIDPAQGGYSVGVDHAKSLVAAHYQGLEIDPPALAQGFSDEIHGRPSKVPTTEFDTRTAAVRKKVSEKITSEMAQKNLEEGKIFLEQNAKQEGVKTTASGLQYQVLKEGDGPQPKATDKVTVHYSGVLLNGKEFDSSYRRNEPTTFPLNQVIKGWTEGVQLMKVGSKYRFFIPPNLAYGEGGAPGGDIGPNSTLIFEVELLKIEE